MSNLKLDRANTMALDTDTVMAVLKTVSADYRATQRRAVRNVTSAAYVTYRLESLSLLFVADKDKRSDGYLEAQHYAEMFGIAKSNITKWRHLGRALMVAGLDPAGEVYGTLQNKGGAEKLGATVLMRDDLTEQVIVEALAEHFTPDGKKIAKAKTESVVPEQSETSVKDALTPDQLAAAAVAQLRDVISAISDKTLEQVALTVADLIRTETGKRAPKAKLGRRANRDAVRGVSLRKGVSLAKTA